MVLPAGDRPGADATQALGALWDYRVYARRWVFLLVLSLLSFSNATVGGLGPPPSPMPRCGGLGSPPGGGGRPELGPRLSRRASHLPVSRCTQGGVGVHYGTAGSWGAGDLSAQPWDQRPFSPLWLHRE